MCTHGRFVTNKYTGNVFWSECGKCKACLQKKAALRSSRIRNEYDGKTNLYFVTLTYDRLSAPYFNQSDFDSLREEKTKFSSVVSPLNIYRRYSIKWNPNKQKYVKFWNPVLLESKYVDVPPFSKDFEKAKLYSQECNFHWLEKQPGKIGVTYFKDIQNFNKRLRSYLKFHGYNEKLKVFNCTEYGSGGTQRPHAHLLIFAPYISQEAFHAAVIKSWPFGRRIRNSKSCQLVNQDPAGYVSSYVNCNSSISPFLAEYFKPGHSASKYFGHGRRAFSLEEVQKKVLSGNLTYDFKRVTNSGEKIFHLPIPKYVVNRWFPLFKGYSRFTSNTVLEFLSRGFDTGFLLKSSFQRNLDLHPRYWIDYTCHKGEKPSDLHSIRVRLLNAYENYCKVFPGSSYVDYAKSYEAAWRCYRSTVYRLFAQDDKISHFYKYDNICLLPEKRQLELHHLLSPGTNFIVDNNCKPQYVNQTILMTGMYDRYDKQKKVSHLCMSQKGILV